MNQFISKGNRNFTIRTATNKDTEQIVELVSEILQEFNFDYSPETSEKDLLDIENTYTNNGGAFEVIENDRGKIIATIALLNIDQETAKLRKMYVDKSYRGLGLGKVLLERMLKKAKELRFDEIILETAQSMKEAIYLYEKYGFQHVRGEGIDSPRCTMLMKKNILNQNKLLNERE